MKSALKKLTPAMVVAMIALLAALGGTAGAATSGLITGAQIKNGTIGLLDLSANAKQSLHGMRGPQGPAGPQGVNGGTGATGSQGSKGDTGTQGPQGGKGDTGTQGTQGVKGDTGTQGPQGANGDTGLTGATGPQGPQGVQGPQGERGPAGERGPQGLSNTSIAARVRSATPSITTGAAGEVMSWSLTGNTWTQGANDMNDLSYSEVTIDRSQGPCGAKLTTWLDGEVLYIEDTSTYIWPGVDVVGDYQFSWGRLFDPGSPTQHELTVTVSDNSDTCNVTFKDLKLNVVRFS